MLRSITNSVRFGLVPLVPFWVTWLVAPVYGDLNDGLVAHWCFDDDSANDCADSYNGVNKDNGAAPVDSPWERAFDFRQTDIVWEIPAGWDNSIVSNQALTVAAWVKWTGPDATYSDENQCLIFDGRSGSPGDQGDGMAFYVAGPESNGELVFHFNSVTGEYRSNGSIPPNVWTHVAVVFDGANDELRLYIMGHLDEEFDTTKTYRDSGEGAAIGNNHWAPTDGEWGVFNGVIDELRVYDRPLTAEELAELAVRIPAVSSWGLAVMTLLVLTTATLVLVRRRMAA